MKMGGESALGLRPCGRAKRNGTGSSEGKSIRGNRSMTAWRVYGCDE